MSNREDETKLIQHEMDYPLLRHIEALPVSLGGGEFIMLRDPEALTDKMLVLPMNVFFIVSRLDGKHSIRDIQVEYNRKFGELIFTDKIEEMVNELDTALLLENDRYRKYMEFLKHEFKNDTVREAKFAGNGYPDDPEELQNELNQFFVDLPEDKTPDSKPLGIISPHIDFQRGGGTYGFAYRELKKSDAHVFVILGTSHHDLKNYFALTKKSFKTPLGTLPVDTEFINELTSKCTTDFFADEYAHRGEHSIEFQALMLKYIFPDRDIKIIPILVSSFDDLGKEMMPSEHPVIKEFIDAFHKTMKSMGCSPAYIAGVDFSHVGLSFGDPVPPTLRQMKSLEEDELKSISFIEKMDADGFFRDVMKDQAKRRVCGLSPIYVMMKCMEAKKAKLLEYRQCCDKTGYANVGVAAMGFYSS